MPKGISQHSNECSRGDCVLHRDSVLIKYAYEDSPGLPDVDSLFSDISITESDHFVACSEFPGFVDEPGEVPGRDEHAEPDRSVITADASLEGWGVFS